jgi:hypothetical protein
VHDDAVNKHRVITVHGVRASILSLHLVTIFPGFCVSDPARLVTRNLARYSCCGKYPFRVTSRFLSLPLLGKKGIRYASRSSRSRWVPFSLDCPQLRNVSIGQRAAEISVGVFCAYCVCWLCCSWSEESFLTDISIQRLGKAMKQARSIATKIFRHCTSFSRSSVPLGRPRYKTQNVHAINFALLLCIWPQEFLRNNL